MASTTNSLAANSRTLNWFAFGSAFLIVAWSPFTGGARVPSLVLALFGAWHLYAQRATLWQIESVRRWALVFLLLWVPILLSLPDSLDARRSINTAAILPAYFLAGIGMLVALQNAGRRERLRVWIAVLLVVWIADGFVQYLFGRDLLGLPLMPDGRVTGVFGDSLRLSWFVALLLPLLLADPRARPVAIGASLVLAAAILEMLIGTRGALLSVMLVAVGWLARQALAARIGVVVLLAAAIVAGTVLSPLSAERLGRLQLLATPSFENLDNILSGRMTIWQTATNMLAAHPLNGVGSGAFAAAYDRYSTLPGDMFKSGGAYQGGPTHAHQMYISIAAETGLIGLAGIIGIVTLCGVWYYRAPHASRQRAWPWGLGLAAIAFPVQSQPVLFTHWWFPVMLLAFCALLAELDDKPPSRNPPNLAPQP